MHQCRKERNQFIDELTYERHHEDTEEDPEGIAEDVHHHDGEQGHGQVGLALPLVTLAAAQDLQSREMLYYGLVSRLLPVCSGEF